MTVTAAPPVSADYPCPPWCDGQCIDGWEGALHSAEAVSVPIDGEQVELVVSRFDSDGGTGQPSVSLYALPYDACNMTAAQARMVAAALLNAADLADGGSPVEVPQLAQHLRVGDHLLTPDGWQTVRALTIFPGVDSVRLFTDERNPDDSDGWPYSLTSTVTARQQPGVSR